MNFLIHDLFFCVTHGCGTKISYQKIEEITGKIYYENYLKRLKRNTILNEIYITIQKYFDFSSKLTHEKRCEYAYKLRYPDQGDQLSKTESTSHPTEAERQDRIQRLATPNRRLLENNYEMYKDVMSPEKSERIKMTIEKMKPISME